MEEKNRNKPKYEDIISKSHEIQLGSPTVYQLKTEEKNIGNVKKITFGKNLLKTNKTILLVGETGTGKSTLINALVNYAMGVKWEDDIWFQIVADEVRDQPESQTLDVIVYEIFGFEDKALPYSLTIIDTPGYGSTRGIKHDDVIFQRLLDLFGSEDGVHEVHAVGLVMKSTDNRLCDRLIYVFDSVMSLFGKDLENNIVALITHSNGKNPKNTLRALVAANVKCAKKKEDEPVYFLFDNCQKDNREEEENDNKLSEKGMEEFIAFLETSAPQTLNMTTAVLNERTRLKACIQNLKERVKLTELKQTEIKQIEVGLKKNQEKMKMNLEFKIEVDEAYKEKEPIDGGRWGLFFYEGAVCCTVCKENCHYPGCTVTWSPMTCKVMKWGRCTVCTKKCHASVHEKEKSIYVSKTRRVEKTQEDMKQKYETNKSKSENKSSLLQTVEEEKKRLNEDMLKLLDESYQHIHKLGEIALKCDSLFIYAHLDLLIMKMKEKGDKEKIQELEDMRSRVDDKTKAGLQYKRQLENQRESRLT